VDQRVDERVLVVERRARRLDQLADNLAALDVTLPEEAVRRLDEASAITLGFPHDFIESLQGFVYGSVVESVDRRRLGTR
jgi:hypothetical protein